MGQVTRALPAISETPGRCAVDPPDDTIEVWCAACELIASTCEQISGHIPKAFCQIFCLWLERYGPPRTAQSSVISPPHDGKVLC